MYKGFRFIQSRVKYGISTDKKQFCVITDSGIDIYDSVDDFLNSWRSWIEKYVLNK